MFACYWVICICNVKFELILECILGHLSEQMFHSILSNMYKNVLRVQWTFSIGNPAVKILDYCTDSVKIAVVWKHDLKIVVYPENCNPKLLIVLDVFFFLIV